MDRIRHHEFFILSIVSIHVRFREPTACPLLRWLGVYRELVRIRCDIGQTGMSTLRLDLERQSEFSVSAIRLSPLGSLVLGPWSFPRSRSVPSAFLVALHTYTPVTLDTIWARAWVQPFCDATAQRHPPRCSAEVVCGGPTQHPREHSPWPSTQGASVFQQLWLLSA